MRKRTTFEKCQDEFAGLAWVNNDPLAQTNISDLLFAAQFEVDLYEEGESEATAAEIAKIKRFLKKWEPYKEQED